VTPVRYDASEERSDNQGQTGASGAAHGIHPIVQGTILVALAVIIVFLFVGGVHSNSQKTRLRNHGVSVDVVVTSCFGVAAGSGSTRSTFTCNGEFSLGGHRHAGIIGGDTTYQAAGAHVRGVADPSDPALFATARSVADEHASNSVYLVPIVLSVALIALVGWVVGTRRRHQGLGDQGVHLPVPDT
jgi:hypothetical protein